MLSVTDFAAAAIVHLLERHHAPDRAGLRIAWAPATRSMTVRLARGPAPDDTVITARNGAHVFLDPAAAGHLDGKILDVTLGVRGRIEFFTTRAAQPIEPGR